jgi:hypothetical protein
MSREVRPPVDRWSASECRNGHLGQAAHFALAREQVSNLTLWVSRKPQRKYRGREGDAVEVWFTPRN